MSLLCWLPLNKDKQNYGCKLDSFLGEAYFANDGKIGKSLIGSSILTANKSDIPNLISKTHICTISCWIKIASGTSAGWVIRLGETKGLKISPSLPQWNDDSFQNNLNLSINNNTWKYVVLTLDGTYVRLYIDGEYISQTTISNTTEINDKTITIGGRDGVYLNDVRIYDNCLSKAEIKEISKGLVLHWKLDSLFFAGSDSSGLGNNGITIGTLTESNNNTRSRYTKALQFNGTSYLTTKKETFSWWDYNTCTLSTWICQTANSTGYFGFITDSNESDYLYKNFSLTNYENKFQVAYNNGSEERILLNSNIAFPLNEWHFFAITLNNSLLQMYVDGEKVSGNFILDWGTAIKNNNTQFQIGKNFIGKCNDVRIYMTPLLDKDIKMLYNTNMRIDNLGGIHSFEFVENNKASITSTGITKGHNFEEREQNASLLKQDSNLIWLSPNFKEY